MKRYFITGATGYIGSMLIKSLLQAETKKDDLPHIIAPVRNMKEALRMFPARVKFIQTDLRSARCAEQIDEAMGDADYIIHCASVTASALMQSNPVEVTESIVNVTQNVLEAAKCHKVKSMVYLSSMEVYGSMDCKSGRRAAEEDAPWGVVELLSSRSCYPLGKRMAENICYSYFKEYGVPVKIARLAQTFGEGVRPADNRVFVQFVRAVKNGEDIVLHTKGNSVGNYCGIHDVVEGIMLILDKGVNGEAYNVVNEANTMTIRQMAGLVAEKIAGGRIKIAYDIAEDNRYGYAADTGLRLSGKKLMSLGWKPKESLEEMYFQLIADTKI